MLGNHNDPDAGPDGWAAPRCGGRLMFVALLEGKRKEVPKWNLLQLILPSQRAAAGRRGSWCNFKMLCRSVCCFLFAWKSLKCCRNEASGSPSKLCFNSVCKNYEFWKTYNNFRRTFPRTISGNIHWIRVRGVIPDSLFTESMTLFPTRHATLFWLSTAALPELCIALQAWVKCQQQQTALALPSSSRGPTYQRGKANFSVLSWPVFTLWVSPMTKGLQLLDGTFLVVVPACCWFANSICLPSYRDMSGSVRTLRSF